MGPQRALAVLFIIGSHQVHRRSQGLCVIYRQPDTVLAGHREHHFSSMENTDLPSGSVKSILNGMRP